MDKTIFLSVDVSIFNRPSDRTGEDLDIIYSRLKDLKAFERFHPLLLQQICYYSYYEDLDQGVIRKLFIYLFFHIGLRLMNIVMRFVTINEVTLFISSYRSTDLYGDTRRYFIHTLISQYCVLLFHPHYIGLWPFRVFFTA